MENSVGINTTGYTSEVSDNISEFVDTKEIKKESLSKLSGNWSKVFAIVGLKFLLIILNFTLGLVNFILTNDDSIIFNYIPFSFLNALNIVKQYNRLLPFLTCQGISIFLYLSFVPLHYGILRWFYLLSRDGTSDFLTIFYYYKSVRKFFITFLFKIVMVSRFLFFGSIFLLPGFALFIFSCLKMQSASENRKILFSLAILGTLIFFICGVFLFIKFAAKYFLMPFLQVTNDENIFVNTKETINVVNFSEEYFRKVFFSFFLWLPLQVFILPMIFVFPYTTAIMFVALNKR